MPRNRSRTPQDRPKARGQAQVSPDEYKALVRASWSEKEFQDAVIDLAHQHGWRVVHFRKVRVQRLGGSVYWETPVAADGKGFLDLELVRERLLKVELKVGKNTLTAEQEAWLEAYESAGVECWVWRPEHWDTIEHVLRRLP